MWLEEHCFDSGEMAPCDFFQEDTYDDGYEFERRQAEVFLKENFVEIPDRRTLYERALGRFDNRARRTANFRDSQARYRKYVAELANPQWIDDLAPPELVTYRLLPLKSEPILAADPVSKPKLQSKRPKRRR